MEKEGRGKLDIYWGLSVSLNLNVGRVGEKRKGEIGIGIAE